MGSWPPVKQLKCWISEIHVFKIQFHSGSVILVLSFDHLRVGPSQSS